jgi:hypothetical protein
MAVPDYWKNFIFISQKPTTRAINITLAAGLLSYLGFLTSRVRFILAQHGDLGPKRRRCCRMLLHALHHS